jgi:hypothetical protein
MFYQFEGFYIPDYMADHIKLYLKRGVPPGSFLTAVICNDLLGACMTADGLNIANLPAYAAYFYKEVSNDAWGSKEKMETYMNNCKRSRGENDNGNRNQEGSKT